MTKTLIYNLPPLDILRPPLSGAILSSVCTNLGHDCNAVDLQQELNAFLTANNLSHNLFNDVFYEHSPNFESRQILFLEQFIQLELQKRNLKSYNFVLISLFSYLAQSFATIFLPKLRASTKARIIIGGAGLVSKNSQGYLFHYADGLKQQGCIDEYITGEAEQALPIYLTQGHGPGIGNDAFQQIDDLDAQLWPDYNFYDIDRYQQNPPELSIVGSRGCVRRCTFCDVARTSPKYRYRSGQNIANEMIHHYEKHGITRFYFTDSLVNGSLKAFDDMCNHLAGYRFQPNIRWSGQYIIRDRKSTPINHFDNLQASGCETLFIGLESGSTRVRIELGKKFTNDDVEFYLENFAHRNIGVLFLMFTGYVSETEHDHAETLSMFPRWQRYVATGTIKGLETLNILSVLPGAPLERIAHEHQFLFMVDQNNEIMRRAWIDPRNPGFDFAARVRRHMEMIECAMQYKWPLWNGQLSVTLYEQALLQYNNMPKKYIPLRVQECDRLD